MAITRTSMQDDDGSGTTGTILNNAWKQELYNQIDGQIVSGAWTPVDMSGAGLALTINQARYWKLDKLVMVEVWMAYPATSHPGNAALGGLPFPKAVSYGGLYSVQAPIDLAYLVLLNETNFYLLSGVTAAAYTNAQLSGANLVFAGVYLTA